MVIDVSTKPGWLCLGLRMLAWFLATTVLEQDAKPLIAQNGQAIVCEWLPIPMTKVVITNNVCIYFIFRMIVLFLHLKNLRTDLKHC